MQIPSTPQVAVHSTPLHPNMRLSVFAIFAFGLLVKAGAHYIPDGVSVTDVNAGSVDVDANIDLSLEADIAGYDAADVYDDYTKRNTAASGSAGADSTVNTVINIVGQLNSSIEPHIVGIRTCLTFGATISCVCLIDT